MLGLVRRGALPLTIALAAGVLAALPADAAPTWLAPPVTLGSGDPGPLDVDVAADAAGNATAVWLQERASDVAVRWSSHPVGGSWSSGEDLATADDMDNELAVASNDAGLTVAAWSELEAGHYVITAATKTPGTAWTTPVPISNPDTNSKAPRVVVDAAGEAVVTWLDNTDSAIVSATRSSSGAWSPPDEVSDTDDGFGQEFHDLAITPGGTAVSVFELYDSALSRRVIQAAVRPPGGPFGDAVTVSDSTIDTWDPSVAVNAAGVATVVWREEPGIDAVVKSATRAADGTWSDDQDVSDDHWNGEAVVAVDAAGTTTAVWKWQELGQPRRILSSDRPLGGDWSVPVDVEPEQGFESPSLAIDASGRLTVAYVRFQANGDVVVASTRAPGGSWTSLGQASALPTGSDTYNPEVVLDAAGDAVVGWEGHHFTQDTDVVQVTALDAAGPSANGLSIPASATIGVPVGMAWPAVDAWSAVSSIAWSFGDGTTASGASVSKTYAAAGSYTVSVIATDAVGNATTRTGTVVVPAGPVVQPPASPKPSLSGVKLTKKKIHVKGSDEKPRLTKLKLRLNTDAKVSIKVKRTKPVKGKTPKARVVKRLPAGASVVRLTSKIAGTKLPPGRYRVVVTARNGSGRSPVVVRFLKILP